MQHSEKARKTLNKIRRKCLLMTGSPDMYYRNDERFWIFLLDRSDQGEIRGRIYLQQALTQKRISNFIINRDGSIKSGPNHFKKLINA